MTAPLLHSDLEPRFYRSVNGEFRSDCLRVSHPTFKYFEDLSGSTSRASGSDKGRMAATVEEGTAHNPVTCKCGRTMLNSGYRGDSRERPAPILRPVLLPDEPSQLPVRHTQGDGEAREGKPVSNQASLIAKAFKTNSRGGAHLSICDGVAGHGVGTAHPGDRIPAVNSGESTNLLAKNGSSPNLPAVTFPLGRFPNGRWA